MDEQDGPRVTRTGTRILPVPMAQAPGTRGPLGTATVRLPRPDDLISVTAEPDPHATRIHPVEHVLLERQRRSEPEPPPASSPPPSADEVAATSHTLKSTRRSWPNVARWVAASAFAALGLWLLTTPESSRAPLPALPKERSAEAIKPESSPAAPPPVIVRLKGEQSGSADARSAVDALATGHYDRALQTYRQLAEAHPESPVYRQAVRILGERVGPKAEQ